MQQNMIDAARAVIAADRAGKLTDEHIQVLEAAADAEAAQPAHWREAVVGLLEVIDDMVSEVEPNYRSFEFRRERYQKAQALLSAHQPINHQTDAGSEWRNAVKALMETALPREYEGLDAPGHRHRVPGIWDRTGKPCDWCTAWIRLRAMLG